MPIDCDVIQADGGTRTASITGAYVATVIALRKMIANNAALPRALKTQVAAISVGSEIPIEPLSQRELEILQLIAQGLSNDEIGERLYLALSTVKGHNRNIFEKLQVKSRTEALARARELGLL